MSISATLSKYAEDLIDISNWCDSQYNLIASKYFEEVRSLYIRFNSNTNPIKDDELELILTMIPLQLFAVSEALATVKAQKEVISLKIKQIKHETLCSSEATSQAGKREEASASVIEDEIVLKAYDTLIERIESEISFSRELIMSAKKIWTSRKQTETLGIGAETAETKETSPVELPDYVRGQ